MPSCPRRDSEKIIKKWLHRNGKSKFHTGNTACSLLKIKQAKQLRKKHWKIVVKMLLERISAAEISIAAGIPEVLIQRHANKKYKSVPKRTESVFKKSVLFLSAMKYGHLSTQRRIIYLF